MNNVLSVVIPVYNEERTLRALLDKVSAVRIPGVTLEIIAVNDGSTDRSPEILRAWRDSLPADFPHSVRLLDKANGGKGSAVRLGIEHSTGGVLLVQDADLEYDPADYERVSAPVFRGECKVVYGTREDANRNRIYSSPGFYLGALSLTFWINLLFNSNLTDEATCYKVFEGNLIRNLPFEGDHFEWEPELTAKLLRLGYEIREVPVSYYPRKTSEGKKIRFHDGIQGFAVAFRWRFRSLRQEKTTLAVEPSAAKQFQQVRYAQLSLLVLALAAVAIRLLYAIPGLRNPELLMRPDSATYLGPALSLLSDGIYAASPGGSPTAFRTPLYPVYLALCLLTGGHSLAFCAAVNAVLGGLTAVPLYLAARLYGSWKTAFFAALLFALNPTAIAVAPLFLSDTLFTFLAACQMLFFLKFVRCRFALFFFVSIFFAGLGALARPINMLWIFPALFVLWCMGKLPVYLKGYYSLFAVLIFGALLVPWMVRNETIGAGFRLDASEAMALQHNTAALESKISGVPAETLRTRFRSDFEEEFSTRPEKYTTESAKIEYQEKMLLSKIAEHPFVYLKMHFRPYVLLPDVPTFLENLGVSESGKGTFDVLNRFGVTAAIRHYFQGHSELLFASIPLVFTAVLTYLLAGFELIRAVFRRGGWMVFLLFLLFAEYYLFLPGPISMPRYQLPALLFFCILAGGGTEFLLQKYLSRRKSSVKNRS